MNKDKDSIVYLVGAGPGDPSLITQKGLKLIKSCDVLIYDRLISEDFLMEVKADCEKIYVGKTVGNHTFRQDEINEIIIKKALEHKTIVRLKGGDPFVFGRGGEEILALENHKIAYEVVPGVTSAIAAASYAGIPVTHRGLSGSFHVITGHTAKQDVQTDEDFEVLSKLKGTLIFLMGMGNLELIVQKLLFHGKDALTPVAIISNGTTKHQYTVRGTLDNIVQKAMEGKVIAPASIVIGEVAALSLLSPSKEKELSGIKVGVTGTHGMTEKLREYLENLGASVEILTSSYLQEFDDNPVFDQALSHIKRYHWIAFTSSYGVTVFFERMRRCQVDYRNLSHIKFAVIGEGTKRTLSDYGYYADYMPTKYTSLDLAQGLSEIMQDEEWLLIPRANLGSEELVKVLQEANRKFDDIKVYDLVEEKREELERIEIEALQYITFASSSGVHHFLRGRTENVNELFQFTKVICIGDVTEKTLQEYGYHKAIVAKEFTAKGLVDAICWDRKRESK